MVLPVASPKRSAGFLRTALATTRAVSRPTSSGLAFNISSICPFFSRIANSAQELQSNA
jgi:hypothetical protein